MSHLTKSFLTLGFFSLFLISCQNNSSKKSIENTLKENPDIVFNLIKSHPEKFMGAVQLAAKEAQNKVAQQREQSEQKQLEESFKNPLEPTLDKSVASIGPKDAPITIVEYSDFECPFCRKGMETVNELQKKYQGKIRFVYKHLPLSFHPQAMITARYFEAIRLQSTELAFKFHDKIFLNQQKLKQGETFLKATAKSLGVNLTKLKSDLKSKEIISQIENDIAEAKKFGLQGTPGFIINGIPVKGAYPASHFEQIIKKLESKGLLAL